jgi:hypothetical protein
LKDSLSIFNSLSRGARCNSTTKHNRAALGHAKLTQNSKFALSILLQGIERRISDMESGKVQGIPLEETLAKARKITGQ